MLCRKSRLFEPLQLAFREAGIPAEFVGLAGLVRMPEVAEVLAYARAVADPNAGVGLARVLLGPRYRVGFKDLARVASWAKGRNQELRDENEDEAAPYLFAEALEHLDEVDGLSAEGRSRLDEFREELVALRGEARAPVPEFLAHVIRRAGLLDELEADVDRPRAETIKRNLAAFLEQVHAFSPCQAAQQLALAGIPKTDGTVPAGRGEELAVGGQQDRTPLLRPPFRRTHRSQWPARYSVIPLTR